MEYLPIYGRNMTVNDLFLSHGITQKTISILGSVKVPTVFRWMEKMHIEPLKSVHHQLKNMRYYVGDVRRVLLENSPIKKPLKSGSIISFYNSQNASGKTMVCYQSASMLAIMGFKVLVIDADPQGDISRLFGIESEKEPFGFFDILREAVSSEKAIQPVFPGLDCIPSNIKSNWVDAFLSDQENKEENFEKAMSPLMDQYDFIFFDMTSHIGPLNRSILAHSQLISFVCDATAKNLPMLNQMVFDIKDFFAKSPFRLPKMFIVPNKYDGSSIDSIHFLSMVSATYQNFLSHDVVIKKSNEFDLSQANKLPFPFFVKSSSLVLEDIKNLTQKIISVCCVQTDVQEGALL